MPYVKKKKDSFLVETYLEQSIRDKSELVLLLFKSPTIIFSHVAKQTGLTAVQLKYYCKELDDFFGNNLDITIKKGKIICCFVKPVKEFYLHQLYDTSTILKLLVFFIKNGTSSQPLIKFSKKYFLSSSSAYRLRESLIKLLREFGLRVSKNTIVGEEYRIRYLIAMLYSKFGIVIYPLDHLDNQVIYRFLSQSATNLRTSPWLEEPFSFYNMLLALSWKRHQFAVSIPQTRIFRQLKKLFIYDCLTRSSRQVIENAFSLTFSQGDLDYLFLIYITTNNSFASLQWTPQHIETCCHIFEKNDTFRLLLEPILKRLPQLNHSKQDLIKALMYFSKSFLFNLQHFVIEIPSFSLPTYTGNSNLYKALKNIVNQWLAQLPGKRHLNEKHLQLFCSHIEQILKNKQPALTVVLISSNFINAKLLTDTIPRYFSDKGIHFYSFYLLRDDIYQIPSLKPDLVITHSRLIPFVKNDLIKGVTVAEFSFDNPDYSIASIQNLIYQLKDKKYQDFLNEQLQ
ncbi:transcriptional regulator Nra [Streptococcus pyogenes]|uniref:transcriptional regulator Nra n=1 Tax=Streptococcus pyogenes TaxID=1314 RepID=UPI0010A16174|nr:transcriptional regulator Nra [Streptococcus pyogenes]VGV08264.1 M trans-acting positive regulator (MGA) PRD domain protein [Streptococcus pyogenes]